MSTEESVQEQGGGTRRNVLMPDTLWHRLQRAAKATDRSIAAVVRVACDRYLKELGV